MKMQIHLNELTYKVTRYASLKGEIKLQKKFAIVKTTEICIGSSLDEINDVKYNQYLKERLSTTNSKSYGCIIEFISVNSKHFCGYTNDRF